MAVLASCGTETLGVRVDCGREQGYTSPVVESQARRGQILVGHLCITLPAVLIIPLFLYWGFGEFGPSLWPYYLTSGLALAWQWHSIVLLRWENSLTKSGLPVGESEDVARRSGLVWPGAGAIGSLALHTTAVPLCGIFLGPWLLSRWFVWILPLFRISPSMPRADYWLQHLELVSIIPALVFGALIARHFERLGAWAWVVPTIVLSYKLLTFKNPNVSVLASAPLSRFSYYFAIQQHMPTFSELLLGPDPGRFVQQIDVTAPFYSGIAYSIGALLAKHRTVDRIVSSLRREPEPEVFGSDEAGVEWIGESGEEQSHEGK